MITGTKELIRDVNVALVLDAIRRYGPISRTEVARRTHLGKSTVSGIVERLLKDGLVVETGTGTSEGGRRPILLDLNPQARYVVAVKLAPESISTALCDLKLQLMPERRFPLDVPESAPDRRRGPAVLAALKTAIGAVVDQSGIDWERVMGIGVVLPGVVEVATGTSVSSHFLTWTSIPLRDELEAHFHVPVVVDNDANAVALAEYWLGSGKNSRCLVGVTLGVGIGAGIVVEGRLMRGAIGGAGEIGHIPMQLDGPPCRCGRRGCLEAIAGDDALVRQAREKGGSYPTREALVEAARRGDPLATVILNDAAMQIGRALAIVVDLFNPDTIVVGGEAGVQAGDLLLAPIRESLYRHAFNGLADRLQLLPSGVPGNPWLTGAALEILEALFKLPWGAVPGVHAVSHPEGSQVGR
ncbi:MAG: ROK family transcriptional regulator [Bacillota bacterium]